MNEYHNQLEKLTNKIESIFGELDNNIAAMNTRINELNTIITDRGNESLEAVQANGKDALERDQLAEAQKNLMAKRQSLVAENSRKIYNEAQSLASALFAEGEKKRKSNEIAAILEAWAKIKEIDKAINQQYMTEASKASADLAFLDSYLDADAKHKLGFIGSTHGNARNYVDQIKDGTVF